MVSRRMDPCLLIVLREGRVKFLQAHWSELGWFVGSVAPAQRKTRAPYRTCFEASSWRQSDLLSRCPRCSLM